MKSTLLLALALAAGSIHAQVESIDVLGLVPGKSSLEDINRIASERIAGDYFYVELGGIRMPCGPKLADGKVADFACLTGGKYTKESNLEVHAVLVKGFTAKFGPPTSRYTDRRRNRLGTEFESEEVWWTDKVGTTLVLYSMQRQIDQGGLLLTTTASLLQAKEAAERKDKERRF
jgi:hypothetical protein